MMMKRLRELLGFSAEVFVEGAPVKTSPVRMVDLTDAQHEVKAKTATLLKMNGKVTLREIQDFGTTAPAKVALRLRRQGAILPEDHDTWAPNANGRGKHKVYYANPQWRGQ